jgi:hypothetical protein
MMMMEAFSFPVGVWGWQKPVIVAQPISYFESRLYLVFLNIVISSVVVPSYRVSDHDGEEGIPMSPRAQRRVVAEFLRVGDNGVTPTRS